jgi:hypothetical protein
MMIRQRQHYGFERLRLSNAPGWCETDELTIAVVARTFWSLDHMIHLSDEEGGRGRCKMPGSAVDSRDRLSFCWAQAARARRLAQSIDHEQVIQDLLRYAAELERRAAEMLAEVASQPSP